MPGSSDFDAQTMEQGLRGMEIKRRIHEQLIETGLTESGIRELQNNEPLSNPKDRVIMRIIVMRSMRDQVVHAMGSDQSTATV